MVQMVLCVILFLALSFPNGLNCVKNDLTFVIDTTSDIIPEFDDIIDFVINITNKLTIGINNTMVAVVTFNTDPTTQFDLDDYSDKTSLISAINDLKKIPLTGDRNTHLALDQVRTNIYIPASGKRSDANSVVILITYGGSVSPVQTDFNAYFLRLAGTTLYSIGVGNFVLDSMKTEDLRNIATDPDNEHVLYIEGSFYLCNNVYNVSSRLDPNVSSVDNCPAIPTTTVTTTSKITTEYLASSTSATTTQTTSTAKGSTRDIINQTISTKGSTSATTTQTISTERSPNDTTPQTTSTEKSTIYTTTQTTSMGGSNTTTSQTTLPEGSITATATQTTSTEKMTTTTTTQITSTTKGSTTATTTHTASVIVTTIATSTLSQSGGSSQVTVISVSMVLVLLIFTAILITIFYLPKYRKRKRYLDVIFILVNEYPDIDNGLGPSKPRYQEVKQVYKNGHSSKFHSYLKLSIMNNGCKPVSR